MPKPLAPFASLRRSLLAIAATNLTYQQELRDISNAKETQSRWYCLLNGTFQRKTIPSIDLERLRPLLTTIVGDKPTLRTLRTLRNAQRTLAAMIDSAIEGTVHGEPCEMISELTEVDDEIVALCDRLASELA